MSAQIKARGLNNPLDRVILAVAPVWAERRARARLKVNAYSSAYDATHPSRLRKQSRNFGDGNTINDGSQGALRDLARNLDRNHDLSRGILDVLVRNVVGPTGISVEPQPRDAAGNLLEGLQQQLTDLWETWSRTPDVTGEFNRARGEQLFCRSWLRDGEALCQYVEGNVAKLTHGSAVPFSLEYLESDMVPMNYNDISRNILQGVQCDDWNRPQTYYVYKSHPGSVLTAMPDLKSVASNSLGHIKQIDRFGQRRGTSIFASVITRLDDLKDYEESERIAAKIAASMAAVIKKGSPEDYNVEAGLTRPQRSMHFAPGMVFDDLAVGESVETIDSGRPNPNASAWRDGQLRAVSAGANVSNSSSSRNYNGTYSAQRQELVEQDSAYKLLSQAFIDQHTAEVYNRFVSMCVLAGLVKPPRGVTFAGLCHALYIPPSMPWIDPVKEANGWALQEENGWIAGSEIARRQGRNPADVVRAEAKWQADRKAAGLVPPTPDTTPTSAAPAAPAAPAVPAKETA